MKDVEMESADQQFSPRTLVVFDELGWVIMKEIPTEMQVVLTPPASIKRVQWVDVPMDEELSGNETPTRTANVMVPIGK